MDESCLFDVAVTGSILIGVSTKESGQEQDFVTELLKPSMLCCCIRCVQCICMSLVKAQYVLLLHTLCTVYMYESG